MRNAVLALLILSVVSGCGNKLNVVPGAKNNTSPIGIVAGGTSALIVAQGDYAVADFSASSDPDGNTLTHSISLKSAPSPTVTVDFDDMNSATPKFVAIVPGDYEIEDAISDGLAPSVKVVKKITVIVPALNGFAPADGSSNISRATSLSAISNGATTKCDFYLGNPALTKVASQIGTSFTPQTFLPAGTVQYWMMLCQNGVGPTFPVNSDVMSFTTATGDSPPAAILTASATSAMTGSTINLTVSGVDPEGSPLAYLTVATGPSGTAVVTNPTTSAPSINLVTAGTYTVSATVNDGTQDSLPSVVTITASNATSAPTGTMSSGVTGTAGNTVTLSVGCSTGDGSATTSVVSVTDASGNSVIVSNPTSTTVTFTGATAGTYTATLTCTSGSSSSVTTTTVTVGGGSSTPGSLSLADGRFWQDAALGGAGWASPKLTVTKAGTPWQVNLSWFPFTATQGTSRTLQITCTGSASTIGVDLKNEYTYTPYATGSFSCNGSPQSVILVVGSANAVPGGSDANAQLSLNFGAGIGEYTLSNISLE